MTVRVKHIKRVQELGDRRYAWYQGETPESAAALFVKRYGREPSEMLAHGAYLYVPLPENVPLQLKYVPLEKPQ